MSRPFPGWAEHDADAVWWGDVTTIVQTLLRQSSIDAADVAAIGVSALGPAMVPVDADGRPLRPGALYGIDTRAQLEIERLNRELGWDVPDAPPGRRLRAESLTPKTVWFREHEPEFWRATQKILGATGYVVHRLTGAFVVDRSSTEALASFYDPAASDWDAGMCARYGVAVSLLPETHEATDVVGAVTADAATDRAGSRHAGDLRLPRRAGGISELRGNRAG